jgi:CheY-like chemotaxis protein
MFALTVPLARVVVARARIQKMRRKTVGLGSTTAVLVVDNEPVILDGMKNLLEGWGCTVHLARGQADANRVHDAALGRIDMILADYHLDNENGITLIQELRLRSRRHTPAILITADRSPAVADQTLANDIHLLRKPIKPAALRAAMSHVAIKADAAE